MDYTKDLYELCEIISKEIADATRKMREGGKLSAGDVEYVDKLTHTLKSIKTTLAMMEAEDGYSNSMNGNGGSYGRYYERSYRRGGNVRRDSYGRYSRDDGMAEDLQDLMRKAPDEQTRQELKRIIDRLERE